jgi:hypothetical protein
VIRFIDTLSGDLKWDCRCFFTGTDARHSEWESAKIRDKQGEIVMAVERVGDMSRQELTRLVEALIEQKITSSEPLPYRQSGSRPIKAVVESMRQNLWTPPPGAKSNLEFLREDTYR